MDIDALAQALLQALQRSQGAQLQTIDTSRRLHNAQINNNQNQAGLLFSTRPALLQQQNLAQNVLPQTAEVRTNTVTGEIGITNSVQDALDQIKAYNDAATELDSL